VAAFTPFPSVLAGPASLVLHGSSVGSGALVRSLTIWAGLTALAVWWVFRRATSKLTINGG
jgi:ABC-type uncharacterized transport system permease subunit